MKVIFLGSGDFAFPLAQQIKDLHDIIGIIVAKPKPKGRGLKIKLPEIGIWAQAQNIKLLMPENPNEGDFIDYLKTLKPDLFVLASYGYILSKNFLSVAVKGSLNVHPSLLPKYRGAAPIQRCLMNGDDKTGITIFYMDEKIDHGEIIFQEEILVYENDNYGILSRRLAEKARSVIGGVLESVVNNTCSRKKQDESGKSLAPKLKKEELHIDWQKPAQVIHNLVRALAPNPGARTNFRDHELKILRTRIEIGNARPGEILKANKNMTVGTGADLLIIEQLKPSNRMEMSGQDFINGVRLQQGEMLV